MLFVKLLSNALKVMRFCRALNRTPIAYESNTLPIWLIRYTADYVIIELHNKRDCALLTLCVIHMEGYEQTFNMQRAGICANVLAALIALICLLFVCSLMDTFIL